MSKYLSIASSATASARFARPVRLRVLWRVAFSPTFPKVVAVACFCTESIARRVPPSRPSSLTTHSLLSPSPSTITQGVFQVLTAQAGNATARPFVFGALAAFGAFGLMTAKLPSALCVKRAAPRPPLSHPTPTLAASEAPTPC